MASGQGLVLGIETSCDDTGAAVVTSEGEVLAESIAGQDEVHAKYGGVVPNLARQAHEEAVERVTSEALWRAGKECKDLSAVAVTQGPGLSPCLRVGLAHGLRLAHEHSVPVIRVHHMEAHALVARLQERVDFPFLALLVSGGHNLVILARGLGDYRILGSTVDDAVGEAFDKTARVLGLTKGGPELEKLAKEGDDGSVPFPSPLKKHHTCDFSFAGLKTAARKAAEESLGGHDPSDANRQERANVAASFQRICISHLIDRLGRGIDWARQACPDLSQVVVAGGVAANNRLRQELASLGQSRGFQLVCPPPKLCTDNGVMVAWAGVERMNLGWLEESPSEEITKETHLEVKPRWPLGTTDPRALAAQNIRRCTPFRWLLACSLPSCPCGHDLRHAPYYPCRRVSKCPLSLTSGAAPRRSTYTTT